MSSFHHGFGSRGRHDDVRRKVDTRSRSGNSSSRQRERYSRHSTTRSTRHFPNTREHRGRQGSFRPFLPRPERDRSERNRSPSWRGCDDGRESLNHQTKLCTDSMPNRVPIYENGKRLANKRRHHESKENHTMEKSRRNQQSQRINWNQHNNSDDLYRNRNSTSVCGDIDHEFNESEYGRGFHDYGRYDEYFEEGSNDDYDDYRSTYNQNTPNVSDEDDNFRGQGTMKYRDQGDDTDDKFEYSVRNEDFPVVEYEYMKEDEIADLVSSLLNIVLKNGGEILISELKVNSTYCFRRRFKDEDHLRSFLIKYPEVFEFDVETSMRYEDGELSDGMEIIRARTKVKLCSMHSKEPVSCKGNCESLHICKFYLLSSCEIKKCKFNHDLGSDDHNITVQRMFYLQKVELPNLKLLLQHDANRCQVTVPVLCRFYNENRCRSKGENLKQPCPYLHICSDYVQGNCIRLGCELSHDLFQPDVSAILCKYCLNPRVLLNGFNRIMELLRWSINDFKETDTERQKIRYTITDTKNRTTKRPLERHIIPSVAGPIFKKLHKVEFDDRSESTTDEISDDSSTDTEDSLEVDLTTTKGSSLQHANNTNDKTTMNHMASSRENEKNINYWYVERKNKNVNISEAERKDIEEKYQKYLSAKSASSTIGGKQVLVDFTKLEGKFIGSSVAFKIQRGLSKRQDKSTENMNTDIAVEDGKERQMLNTKTKSENGVLFRQTKDVDFIKI